MKIGVIFGGKSTERSISVMSAKTVIDNLDIKKYIIYKIYIDEKGEWYECSNITDKYLINDKKIINNIIDFLKNMDVLFPVLHGKYGEDGTIQGLFEMINVPYVGCKVLSSSACMDKIYTKTILNNANINQCNYRYIKKYKDRFIYIDNEFNEYESDINGISKLIEENLKYPMFVKPSRSGSSIGINKVNNKEELITGIQYASKFDNKIIIEEEVIGKEVECAVLGNEDIITSIVGEIIPDEEFYSFDSKYKNNESKLLIPAIIEENISNEIREIAKKAYKTMDCKGLSRVDFLLEKDTNKIFLNEINTLPGFTNISMYPMLFKKSGIKINDLLDKLINMAFE